MAIALGACSTPYATLKDISSFEELDYKYPVKVYLPENEFTIAYADEGKAIIPLFSSMVWVAIFVPGRKI